MSTTSATTREKPKSFCRRIVREAAEMFRALLLLLLAVVVIFVAFRLTVAASRAVDSARFHRFTHRIANADRVVASMRQGVSVSIAGEDAKRLVQAVSSAKRERPPWGLTDACIYDVHVTFFRGSDALEDILSCTSLFIVSGKKYQDESGVLGTLAVAPAHTAYVEWGRKQMESK